MPSSDSEDFESADEGSHDGNLEKKERKKRISSACYSDNIQDSTPDSNKSIAAAKDIKPMHSMVKKLS